VVLTGTADKDVLFGTGTQDQFVFAANMNHDTIRDFAPGYDKIDLQFSPFVVNDETSFQVWASTANHVVQQGPIRSLPSMPPIRSGW